MTIRIAAETPGYELSARRARLVRTTRSAEAVKSTLPELLGTRTDQPGRATARCSWPGAFSSTRACASRRAPSKGRRPGRGRAGDVLRRARWKMIAPAKGGTRRRDQFVVELKIDEIVDWLWEELKLPELKPRRSASLDYTDYVREGWTSAAPVAPRIGERRAKRR